MKVRIVILGLCWLALSTQADADAGVRAQSAEECAAYADLALVASTLAKHGIAKDQAAKMMPDMYELQTDDAREIARRIVDSAYGTARPEPKVFANRFGSACLRNQGRMDAILGARI